MPGNVWTGRCRKRNNAFKRLPPPRGRFSASTNRSITANVRTAPVKGRQRVVFVPEKWQKSRRTLNERSNRFNFEATVRSRPERFSSSSDAFRTYKRAINGSRVTETTVVVLNTAVPRNARPSTFGGRIAISVSVSGYGERPTGSRDSRPAIWRVGVDLWDEEEHWLKPLPREGGISFCILYILSRNGHVTKRTVIFPSVLTTNQLRIRFHILDWRMWRRDFRPFQKFRRVKFKFYVRDRTAAVDPVILDVRLCLYRYVLRGTFYRKDAPRATTHRRAIRYTRPTSGGNNFLRHFRVPLSPRQYSNDGDETAEGFTIANTSAKHWQRRQRRLEEI